MSELNPAAELAEAIFFGNYGHFVSLNVRSGGNLIKKKGEENLTLLKIIRSLVR